MTSSMTQSKPWTTKPHRGPAEKVCAEDIRATATRAADRWKESMRTAKNQPMPQDEERDVSLPRLTPRKPMGPDRAAAAF